MSRLGIYAVHDTVADIIVGGLQTHRAEASAIRTFGDAASMKGSVVQMHPGDFQLLRLGWINDDHSIEPDAAVVMTGATWLAAQQPSDGEGAR